MGGASLHVLGVKRSALRADRLSWSFRATGTADGSVVVLVGTDLDARMLSDAWWFTDHGRDGDGLPQGLTAREVLERCRRELELLQLRVRTRAAA